MDNFQNYCKNCFEQLNNSFVCPHCNFDNSTQNDTQFLPTGYFLCERYIIGRVVETYSDGVVYSAYDKIIGARITVKEYLPRNLANRLEGNTDVHIRERYREQYDKEKREFIKLWQTLQKIRNLSAIIPVYDVFEANETAYSVSEYFESVTLRDYLLHQSDGMTDWEKARIMFMPVLTTIETLHANGIIHGAICPDNLILCRDGKVRLVGFEVPDATKAGTDLEFDVKDGYTAIEQYQNSYKIGTHTDLYAFTACIYRSLVGNNPPDAPSRETNDKLMIPNTVAEKIPVYVIKALGSGLQIKPERRTKTAEELRDRLNANPSVSATATAEAIKQSVSQPSSVVSQNTEDFKVSKADNEKRQKEEDEKKKKKKTAIIVSVVAVVLVLAVVGTVVGVKFANSKKNEEAPSVSLQQYEVPDFSSVGYSKSDIEQNAVWNKQFKITYTEEYSSDFEEGIIFGQSVSPGQTVSEGSSIVLTVSKGTHMEKLPDVGGLAEKDAVETLEKLGFKVKVVPIANDGTNAENTVKKNFGMSPSAGSEYEVGKEVIIQVYEKATTAPPTTEPSTEETTEDPTKNQIIIS